MPASAAADADESGSQWSLCNSLDCLWLVELTQPGNRLMTPNVWLQIALYSIVFSAILYILDLPLSFYESYTLPKRFEMSNQTWPGWINDQSKRSF